MKIAICDDEKNWREYIQQSINEYMGKNGYQAETDLFPGGNELLLSKEEYSLIFLDVEMADTNGLEVARKIRIHNEKVKIVFITSHPDIMQKAFHVNAYRFLEKTFKTEGISDCLKDYFSEEKENKRIEIMEEGRTLSIVQKDIITIQVIKNGCMIETESEHILSGNNLSYYEKILEPKLFCRCNYRTLINFRYTEWIEEEVTMYNGKRISISRRRKKELNQRFKQYLIDYKK